MIYADRAEKEFINRSNNTHNAEVNQHIMLILIDVLVEEGDVVAKLFFTIIS